MGITISLAGAAIAGALGWILQTQILALFRALASVSPLVYLWLLTVALLIVWVVAQFTGLQTDTSFRVVTSIVTVMTVLASFPSRKNQKPDDG